ncbi:hypothetical protein [Halosegnis longus]|uniref:Uncharacterized protein n=1 Tax=Halosegnis longus TaxID=2216012 RepID=A0AAJ4UWG6_9EURY|nr:hypothetical protein Nmn1133_10510 [Salella cibi]
MDIARTAPVAVVAVVALTALVSGPTTPLDFTPNSLPCDSDVRSQVGNATVDVRSLPDRATLTQTEYGARVWTLSVPPAVVNVSDVQGRPAVSYRIFIPELGRQVGSRTVVSSCTTGRISLTVGESTFPPDEVAPGEYNATVSVIYRGTDAGQQVERTLAERTITVVAEKS